MARAKTRWVWSPAAVRWFLNAKKRKRPDPKTRALDAQCGFGADYFLASLRAGAAFAAFFRSAGLMPVELVMMSHEIPCSKRF